MDSIQKKLLEEVAGLHEVPQGAYSLRINGSLQGKNSSENIEIVQKTDKPGIDIYIKRWPHLPRGAMARTKHCRP